MSVESWAEGLYNEGRARGSRWLEIAYDCYEINFESRFHSGDEKPPFIETRSWETRGIIDLSLPLAPQLGEIDLAP